jgi:hypothetical protein
MHYFKINQYEVVLHLAVILQLSGDTRRSASMIKCSLDDGSSRRKILFHRRKFEKNGGNNLESNVAHGFFIWEVTYL